MPTYASDYYSNRSDEPSRQAVGRFVSTFEEKGVYPALRKFLDQHYPDGVTWTAAFWGKRTPLSTHKPRLLVMNNAYCLFTVANVDLAELTPLDKMVSVFPVSNLAEATAADGTCVFSLSNVKGQFTFVPDDDNPGLTVNRLRAYLIRAQAEQEKLLQPAADTADQAAGTTDSRMARLTAARQQHPAPFSYQYTDTMISSSPIPDGFVFVGPVIASATQPFGMKNYFQSNAGYLTAWQKCLNVFRGDIEKGTYDGVFNIRLMSNIVEGDYDMVMYGDAVRIAPVAQDAEGEPKP